MSTRIFLNMLFITLLFSLLMFMFPQTDLAISQFFYNPQHGFFLSYYFSPHTLYTVRILVVWLTYGLLIFLGLRFLLDPFLKNRRFPFSAKTCLFILICFAIAPGLTVNYVLKDHWGRARPIHIQQFGGDKKFTPAWDMSNQCGKNCSFTSGETANVFCYLAFLFVVRRRSLVTTLVILMGSLMAFERMAQGDHFFSDVILSGMLDYLIIWIIYQVMQSTQPSSRTKNKDRRNIRGRLLPRKKHVILFSKFFMRPTC